MYEDMNQNSYGGFDPDSTTYHYSYQPQGGATPPEPKKPKKKSGAGKVVALVLCCALVGGGAGIGGAAAWNALTVGIGEVISCGILGVALVKLIESNAGLRRLFCE